VSLEALKAYITYRWQRHWEHALYSAADPFLADRREPNIAAVLEEASIYMERNIGGEAMSIVGRTIKFAREGAALVVNCAPFGCMPGTISTALFRHVTAVHGMPVVNMFYDGQGNQNQRLAVFLNNAMTGRGETPEQKAAEAKRAAA
jgi:predicted nucleotide-binding protein (sugar kinase/HSP70/actin superfamily)